VPTPVPTPIPTPTPSESFDVVPDAEAAARARQEAENNRRYAAERARQEAEEAEREAFRKRQEAAAALFEQPVAPTPTPLPGEVAPVPTDSGRWGPAPTPTPAPGPVAPSSQLPGAAEAKRFAPRPSTQHAPPKPGDLVCDSCGAGNDPNRKFCRQCGSSLVAAVVEPKVPWWKRFFRRNKRKVPPPQPTGPGRPTKKTQRRRTTRKFLGYFRMGVALLAVAAVLGITFIDPWRKSFTDFTSCKKRQVQAVLKPPVRNVQLKGNPTPPTSSREGVAPNTALKAFDSNPATFWLAPPPTPADPLTTLTAEFAGTATIRQIHFFPGLPKASNPGSQPTPKTVVLTFRNAKGEVVGKQERFVLETNVAKEDQLLKLKTKKRVDSVEVAILDVHASQTGGTQVAISDIQFFGSPATAASDKCNVS
jgi:hypothetical protein